MNERTETQRKFSEKFRIQTGFNLDWGRYAINRGRGWSRSGGTCGASIYGFRVGADPSIRATPFCLDGPIVRFLAKKYFFVLNWETFEPLGAIEIFRGHKDGNGRIITD